MALGNKLGALYFSKGTTLTFVDLTPKQWRGVSSPRCCEDGSERRTSLWQIIHSFLETVKGIHCSLPRHVYRVQKQVSHIEIFVLAWDAGHTDSKKKTGAK